MSEIELTRAKLHLEGILEDAHKWGCFYGNCASGPNCDTLYLLDEARISFLNARHVAIGARGY